jgi:chorismate mutase
MNAAELQRRIAEISLEIRNYPTPIARCDEQLSQLLEERARLMAQLEALRESPGCSPEARWNNDGGMNAA